MSNISNRLQLRTDRPLDPTLYATLATIDAILKRVDCSYMLIGATARDLLLHNVFGKDTTRMTQDVDIAVLIESWERFESVKSEFLLNTDFKPSTSKPYRVYYRPDASAFATPVDILPFGDIATEGEAFHWPSPHDRLFINVMAFADTYASSLTLNIASDFDLRIASIPGLVLLKLLAYVDRLESKDAQDVLRLIETYGDAGNEDRLYTEKAELLSTAGYNFELAGAQLLAEDALTLASPNAIETVRILLSDQKRRRTLESHFRKFPAPLDDSLSDNSGMLFSVFAKTFLGD